ncbi:cell division control protein Cdc6 [Thermococci archaeon]|nr:MAG: cell division control protein Cdc6 [Thermococci archaeon]
MEVQKTLTELFDTLLRRETIFRNKEALRHTYTPEHLPHREREISRLARILVSPLRGETPSNVFIYGKTGTGKTAVAKFVGRELKQVGEKKQIPIEVVYINCVEVDTRYRVLANLAYTFGEEVPLTGWPTDQVYKSFFNSVDSEERFVVIILDEIDKLVKKSGDDVLYNLTRMNSELRNSKVSVVGITNDLKLVDYLDPRVKSSLSQEEIVFEPYNALQLRDILGERAKIAFKDGVVTKEAINLCAALAAQEHGDARRALDLLRISGEIAEEEGSQRVEESHVRKAKEKLEQDRIIEVIRTLPKQSKLVLYSVLLLGRPSSTGEVYDLYRDLCHRTGVEVLTQRRVSDLISELDMLGIINAKVVSKGRYGRTKEISLGVPPEKVSKALEELI